jgi:hypothetical protein
VDRRRFLLAAASVPLALRDAPDALARAAAPLALVTAAAAPDGRHAFVTDSGRIAVQTVDVLRGT